MICLFLLLWLLLLAGVPNLARIGAETMIKPTAPPSGPSTDGAASASSSRDAAPSPSRRTR